MIKLKQDPDCSGFTLIEFAVVLAIVGVLAAIALPSFLNQKACACKSRASEAKQYVGTLLRTQQAFLLEEKRFAASFSELTTPVPSETTNYNYSLENHKDKTFVFSTSKKAALKSYVGGVFIKPNTKTDSQVIFCEAKELGTQKLAPPIDANTCGEGSINFKSR